jgi:transketolase
MDSSNFTMGTTNLDVFANTLIDLAKFDKDIIITTSDSRGSGKVIPFIEKYPAQLVEIGIAEQNLVGVSAGLASFGKKVFAVSPACFLTARALEQIKNDVAYSNQPVKVTGISAGVSYGALGTTHHSIHDLAVLQAINNIDIIVPADNFETEQTIRAVVNSARPVYIRFGKKAMPNLHPADTHFAIGKVIQMTPKMDNYDVCIIGIGEALAPALSASQILQGKGITSCVLSNHTLRPFDEISVLKAASCSKVIITVEEHSVNGGLGSRVAALLMQAKVFRPLKIIGIPDEHTVIGNQNEIFYHYGLTAESISNTAVHLLDEDAV